MLSRDDVCRIWQENVRKHGWPPGTTAEVFVTALLKECDERPAEPGAGPWLDVETRPLPTGKYLVGHRGHQEIIWFFGQDTDWAPGTKMGWQKDPATFRATHCALIVSPGAPS